MLIALLTILLLGGGTSKFLDFMGDSEDAVKTVMAKDGRQKDALNVLKAMEKTTKGQNKQIRKSIKELGKLIEGRDDVTSEIDGIIDRHFENLDSYSSDIIELRFELKEQITREEWGRIFPVE